MYDNFFEKELEIMRENYKQNPPIGLIIAKEPPLEDELTEENIAEVENSEKLDMIFLEEKILIREADVFWGCIVQANTNLFRRFPPFNYPACMIYSPDPVLGVDIEKLYNIAQEIFSYKNHPEDAPEELGQLVEWVTDEITRFFNVPLPDSLTDGRMAYITTFWVNRRNLPGKKIKQRLVPILAAPDKCKSSYVLPKKFWSKNFINQVWTKW